MWLAPERLTYTLCTTWTCFGQWTLIIQGLRHTNLNTNDCRKHRRPNSAAKMKAKSLYRPLVSACSACHKPRWDCDVPTQVPQTLAAKVQHSNSHKWEILASFLYRGRKCSQAVHL